MSLSLMMCALSTGKYSAFNDKNDRGMERSRGRRARRRSRSGEGIVRANRKTEICLHWQNGTCPYGAGSCAFAHGLGELRHPTLNDETIAGSVSEDSESCPSSRDVSPSSERQRKNRGRDRRLPTFVHLSTGTTPVSRGGGAGRGGGPGSFFPNTTQVLSDGTESSSPAFSDSAHGLSAALEVSSLAPLTMAVGAEEAGGGASLLASASGMNSWTSAQQQHAMMCTQQQHGAGGGWTGMGDPAPSGLRANPSQMAFAQQAGNTSAWW